MIAPASRVTAIVLGVVVVLLGPVLARAAADPDAAERQYRVARRLAAEGSREAEAALRRVVELDPQGRLADDAWVEIALARGAARSPERLGGIAQHDVGAAADALDHVVDDLPGSDRALEARWLRGLLRLEPVVGRDETAARLDLVAVATAEGATPWAAEARYALGWLYQRQGLQDRARDAFQRLVIDRPEPDVVARAAVGIGRIHLRDGRYGEAARWLQQAFEAGATASTWVEPLRELALRNVIFEPGTASAGGAFKRSTGLREPCCLAPTPSRGTLLADDRAGRIYELDADGALVDEWQVDGLHAVTVDFSGTRIAAAGNSIHLLLPGGERRLAGTLGDFAPASAIAGDGTGRFWFLDRKGQRLGRVDAGSSEVTALIQDRSSRLRSLAWDGRRLVAIDGRSNAVVAIGPRGAVTPLLQQGLQRPLALAADPAGRVAVLDAKAGVVVLINAAGLLLESYPFAIDDVGRPGAVGLGLDGSMHLLDAGTGDWVRRR